VFSETANTLAGETVISGCVGGGSGISSGSGGGGPSGAGGGGPSDPSGDVPEPGSSELMGLGCLLGIVAWRKLRASL